MKEKIIKFLFPNNFQDKKKSMDMGFLTVMFFSFISGLVLFFVITGYRLRFIINYPILALVTLFLTIGFFYFSYLARKMAIACRGFNTFEELRTLFIFFIKRFVQLVMLPSLVLAVQIYKLNDVKEAIFIFIVIIMSLLIMVYSERNLILRKWDNDQLG